MLSKIATAVKAEISWLSILVIFLVVIYSSSIFEGKSLSLASQISRIDTAFSTIAKQTPPPCDWSIFLLTFPFEQTVSNIVKKFDMPLWSPYQGCGISLIGDIDARPFFIPAWLAPISSEQAYSIRLVFQIFLSSAFLGLTASRLRWPTATKLWLALTWAVAPLHLYQYELSSSSWLFPPALFFIVLAITSKRLCYLYCSSVGLGFVIFSAHPEVSFFAIGLGTIVGMALVASESTQPDYKQLLIRISTLALLTFGLTSFVLIPFAEWLKEGYLYKSDTPTPWVFNGLSLLVSMFLPICGSLSPFLGPFGFFLLLVGISSSNNNKTPCSACLTFLFSVMAIFITRPGVFEPILSKGILAWLYPVYLLPLFFMTGLLLCARGINALIVSTEKISKLAPVLLMCVVVSIALISCSFLVSSPNFSYPTFTQDPILVKESYSQSTQRLIWWIASSNAALLLFIAATRKLAKERLIIYITGILTITTVGSNMLVPGWKLGAYSENSLICPSLIASLTDKRDRLLPIGRTFLAANLPSAFRIHDIRFFDAVLPRRLAMYEEISGAKTEEIFWRTFSPLVDWRINLASVEYLASEGPIFDATDNCCDFVKPPNNDWTIAGNGLRVKLINFYLDSEGQALLADFKVIIHKPMQGNYRARLVCITKTGTVGNSDFSELNSSGQEQFIWHSPTKLTGPITMAIEIEDRRDASKPTLKLQLPQLNVTATKKPKRFTLTKTDSQGRRLYKNQEAYPESYFANDVVYTTSLNDSIIALQSHKDSAAKLAVIESAPVSQQMIGTDIEESSPEVHLRENNKVLIKCRNRIPRWLILTDSYYPGWLAKLDGKPTEIRPANINFRAIFVPAGEHQIEYSYEPKTFWYPFFFAVALNLTLIYLIRTRQRERFPKLQ